MARLLMLSGLLQNTGISNPKTWGIIPPTGRPCRRQQVRPVGIVAARLLSAAPGGTLWPRNPLAEAKSVGGIPPDPAVSTLRWGPNSGAQEVYAAHCGR